MTQAVEEYDMRRDGVSQAERQTAALKPDYILVDERSTRDLLAFAKKYAADLNFFKVENGEPAAPGDWTPFFTGVDLDEAIAYLEAPQKFTPDVAAPYARPHFALFLAFLQLLRHAQDQFNGLTKRHLDYYYQQVLRLTKRDSIPDQVNVLVDLPPRLAQFTLPAGTRLDAGVDSQGQPLVYRTDADITANQAQVAKLHTVFADRSAVGLADVWENKNIPAEEALIRLFEMTWGDPAPGDPLPLYPLLPNDLSAPEEARQPLIPAERTLTNLETLSRLVKFVPDVLYLDFAAYHELNTLRKRYEQSDPDWQAINQILEKAGKTRDPNFFAEVTNLKDFDANLAVALDKKDEDGKYLTSEALYQELFRGIPNVDTLYEAYNKRLDYREELKARLFLPVDSDQSVRSDDEGFPVTADELAGSLEEEQLPAGLPSYLAEKGMPLPQDIMATALKQEGKRQWHLVKTETGLVHILIEQDEQDVFSFYDQLTFTTLMSYKLRLDSEWEAIVRILTGARQTRIARDEMFDPDPVEMPELAPKDFGTFNEIIQKALGFAGDIPYPEDPFVGTPFEGNPLIDLVPITNLAAYETHLQTLETYFAMPAADFHYFMDLALKTIAGDDENGGSPEWATVFAILDKAHKKKVYRDRRAKLRAKREDAEGGFDAMLYLALGIDDPADNQDPLDLLGRYSLSAENLEFLGAMRTQGDEIEADDPRWEKTYDLVESIQRVVLPEPVPQIETWRNLHPLAEAKSAVARLGVAGEAESTRWQTFGQAMTGVGPPEPTFGWAISSPLLTLSQGTRTITLTLGFEPDAFQGDALRGLLAYDSSQTPPPIPFRIDVSTGKGWVPTVAKSVQVGKDGTDAGSYRQLIAPAGDDDEVKELAGDDDEVKELAGVQFTLEFGEDVDPLTALPPAENLFNSSWPILRLMMQAVAAPADALTRGDYTPYLTFKDLVLRRVHLEVAVENLQPSHLQNDDALLKPGKPFEPFGLRPAVGSRFYVGHPELVNKKLDSLEFKVEWMGVPKLLKDHYHNYISGGSIVNDNTGFKTQVSLVNQRVALPLTEEASALFNQTDATQVHIISLENIPAVARLLAFTPANAVAAWDRYLQWELGDPDFQHSAYPGRAAQLSIEMAAAIANKETVGTITASDYQINPPYTPKIKNLTLSYTSSLEIEVSKYQTGAEIDQLYHIHPFGYSEFQPGANLTGAMFLPQFDYEGELYIGLRNLGTAQTLSLLFQMAEGSADPDLPVEPVRWHYLSGNRWLSLEQGRLLADGTRGLINTGILRFKLDPAEPNTLLDPDLYWLRAAIRRHSNSVCDTLDIHTQAVSATFVDQDNAPDHLSRPLPPETIADLVHPKPQVAAIRQPYPSYGGKTPEQDAIFYTRISERLRHKDRALTQWDYEHLILERFPQIYKVKCLPAPPDRPGQATIVVIPDIRHNDLFDPFEPKVAANVIADIEAYLARRISAHAGVIVKNPHYVPLKVRFAVRFQPGVDEGYAVQQLNDDLNRFLSPWAYDETGDIVIGGRIYANTLVNFIEERPYVDFVAEIKLFSSEDGESFKLAIPSTEDGYWIEPERPDGVLVAARRHEIDLITEAGYDEDSFKGINYMRIELDFIVG